MPTSAIGSVIIAAASAVMKTALIGAAGFFAVKRPKTSPLLPIESVNMLSRMSFVLFSLPLIYTGIAANISLDQLQSLWYMIVAATIVIGTSYMVATILGSKFCPCFGMHTSPDFDALRISATFPNTLAIPILIFPTLCEYEVVYTAFVSSSSSSTSNTNNREALIQQCKQSSNGMVFAYFFAWSLLFWSVGNQLLIRAGTKRQEYQHQSSTSSSIRLGEDEQEQNDPTRVNQTAISQAMNSNNNNNNNNNNDNNTHLDTSLLDDDPRNKNSEPVEQDSSSNSLHHHSVTRKIFTRIKEFIIPIISSSGFIVMVLGFITACIRPLQTALFKPGGVLRFIGSALESLGNAATSLTCIVVAASLAVVHSSNHPSTTVTTETTPVQPPHHPITTTPTTTNDKINPSVPETLDEDYYKDTNHSLEQESNNHNDSHSILDTSNYDNTIIPSTRFAASLIGNDLELPIITQQQGKKRQFVESIQHLGSSFKRRSTRLFKSIQRSPTLRMHIWYNVSRLVLSPAITCGILIALDCGGILSSFPPLGKLVILVNAAVPGGLIVVVILKAKGLSESASIVARIYLPSYLLSIVTIAGWTAVGLMISIPRSDGQSYCSAR